MMPGEHLAQSLAVAQNKCSTVEFPHHKRSVG
jgi:hypothetical protein